MVIVLVALLSLLFSCALPRIAIVENPLTSEEHVNLGYIYEKQGKVDLAQEEYKKAIRKDKRNWIAYYNLGNLYAKREDWEKAEEFYLRALEIKRDPDLLNNLTYVLNKKGETCLALRLIKEAIEKQEKEQYKGTLREIEKKGIECLPFEGERELW